MSLQKFRISRLNIPPVSGLILGIMAVSTASIFIRFAQGEMPSLVIAAGRMIIASLFLAPFVIISKFQVIKQLTKKEWLLLSLAGVFLGGHFAVWITSLEYTSIASSVVIVTTAPLWVAFLSPFILGERPGSWVIVGLVVSLIGSMVVGFSSNCEVISGKLICSGFQDIFSRRQFIGNFLALIGAFLSAGYLLVGRKARANLDLSTYAFLVYSIAAIVLAVAVLISGLSFIGYSAENYVWVVLLALIPQLIGHSAFNWALKYLSASFVSIALLGEPVGTIILAYLFLKETPAILEIAGGFLILVGIALATLRKRVESSLIVEETAL